MFRQQRCNLLLSDAFGDPQRQNAALGTRGCGWLLAPCSAQEHPEGSRAVSGAELSMLDAPQLQEQLSHGRRAGEL